MLVLLEDISEVQLYNYLFLNIFGVVNRSIGTKPHFDELIAVVCLSQDATHSMRKVESLKLMTYIR